MNQLKYNNQINKHFGDFDFKGFTEREILSYRWVFENINDIRNFTPPYINNPARDVETPTGFALSFFETKDAGICRLKTITSNKPNLLKRLGTHIAEGKIVNSDGICCDPDKNRHFDLFEYLGTDLKANFTILGHIV